MSDIITSITNTPIPVILIIIGSFLLFIAIGGQFRTTIVTDKINPKLAGIVGSIFLTIGLTIYIVTVPHQAPVQPAKVAQPLSPEPSAPTSARIEVKQSNYSRDHAALDEAKKVNSADAYDTFIKKHPNSDWKASAIYLRDQAILDEAKKVNTVDAYETFIKKYPNSDWKASAIYLRDRATLDEAKKVNSVDAYDTFIKKHPNSDWKASVIYLRDQAALDGAKKVNTVNAYETFIT